MLAFNSVSLGLLSQNRRKYIHVGSRATSLSHSVLRKQSHAHALIRFAPRGSVGIEWRIEYRFCGEMVELDQRGFIAFQVVGTRIQFFVVGIDVFCDLIDFLVAGNIENCFAREYQWQVGFADNNAIHGADQ